ncbi:hypothetical protein ACJJTC_001018 [Scirpophaga incertulas]
MEVKSNQQKVKHVLHELPHHQQRFRWDCGVSCVLMVLPEPQRSLFLENFTSICQQEGFNQSTWTIDLCYLLKRFNVKHEMYTSTLGVNEENKRHSYYKKILDQDRERPRGVARAGRAATGCGAAGLPLVPHNKLGVELGRWLGSGYRGHYVVVCGVAGERVVFRDPAVSARLCAVSDRELAHARAAPGTDADVILVYADAPALSRRCCSASCFLHTMLLYPAL